MFSLNEVIIIVRINQGGGNEANTITTTMNTRIAGIGSDTILTTIGREYRPTTITTVTIHTEEMNFSDLPCTTGRVAKSAILERSTQHLLQSDLISILQVRPVRAQSLLRPSGRSPGRTATAPASRPTPSGAPDRTTGRAARGRSTLRQELRAWQWL